MKKIGFGIIGSGSASIYHIKAIDAASDAKLIGIYSVDKMSAERLATEYNVRCFECIDDMIDCAEIDIINICTPSGTHAELAERLLLAGKHVVIEKPIALTPSDAERVCLASQTSGRVCSVISQLRFFDNAQRIKNAVDSCLLGKITFASAYMKYYRSPEYYAAADWRGKWSSDGGLLMNQGVHGIDLFRYFV